MGDSTRKLTDRLAKQLTETDFRMLEVLRFRSNLSLPLNAIILFPLASFYPIYNIEQSRYRMEAF